MVRLVQVSASYAPQTTCVLNDISFRVSKGESVALIGANGAGKTSLLLAITGILPIRRGAVFIDGDELSKRTIRTAQRKTGLVFQNPDDQLFMPRVYDDALFGLLNRGIAEEEADRRVRETLDRLGVGHLADRSPFRLSGGEKRLCALAAVLAMEPEVLLFDEPTAFLDPKARRVLRAIIRSLPHTKLVATHDLDFAQDLCSRALILCSGALAADGDPAALFADAPRMTAWGL
ncbi:MAG: energy-coupling factor ABC transporter ATP-binding protein [Treponema sp.]|jgi:cobalt/nickel transport system ATP-binding protein|nr:energy-coupling factor ABC transporter ATP-binding protein [Treponema sp.]